MHTTDCEIVEVGKRRDGGTRFWCVKHGANATAKYGVAAEQCVAANDEPVSEEDTIRLFPEDFPGGIALWGAVPPVYDTTSFPIDRGIHVHARKKAGTKKELDKTYRRVLLPIRRDLLADDWTAVEEIDAINFMVSSVLGFSPSTVICPRCGTSHLDRDWFAVHPHKRHLCHGCGKHFSDANVGVGNPIALLQRAFSQKPRIAQAATEKLEISQDSYPGGIQVWGSNPAIVWTSPVQEKEGIHIHAYNEDLVPVIDGTYAQVSIDGVLLLPKSVRTYMAQMAMPHIADRVTSVTCSGCHQAQFDMGVDSYTPSAACHHCGRKRSSPSRYQKVIANPLVDQISALEQTAPNLVRRDRLNLRPETI